MRLPKRRMEAGSDDAPPDSGTTLVEMLAVIVILSIVLAIVMGTVIAAQKTTRVSANRVTSGQDAKLGIDAMSRNLRTAVLPQLVAGGSCANCPSVAFVQGTPTSVQFYANNNSDPARLGPTKVTYTLASNGQLTETIQKPDAHDASVFSYTYCTPSAACPVQTRVLVSNVNATRIFTYYNKAGDQLTGSTLNAAQLAQVDSMDVNVPIKIDSQTTTLVQRVTLPNADSVPIATASP